jgi:glycosyltransferase involved in cell wall biosynthesis
MVRSVKHQGQRAIVFLTSDRTLADIRRTGRRRRGAYGEIGSFCRYALRTADAVVVQSETQQRVLRDTLGLTPFLIRNPIDLRSHIDPRAPLPVQLPGGQFALWVGRGDTFSKRADLCLDLARQCPHIPFLLIMNRQNASVDKLLRAQAPGNVTIAESVPFAQIEACYRRAVALVNTSEVEGFPNSFLQAGKYGVPVLSLQVDPDGMLGRHHCGWQFKGNLSAMARQLGIVWQGGPIVRRKGAALRRYVQQHHGLLERVSELEQVLRGVAQHHAAA